MSIERLRIGQDKNDILARDRVMELSYTKYVD